MLEFIINGIIGCFAPLNLLALVLGVILGILVGALPGFGAATGLILVLPLTYSMDPGTAFITLTGIYVGAEYGGSISSILLNTPGTGGALVTCFDGFPMARTGRAREALYISNIASFSGGIISGLVMLLCMPLLSGVVLKVGAGEIFVLAIIGLLLVGAISGADPIKGVSSAALGVFMTCIGADSFMGNLRFDFGLSILYGGIPFIPVMLAVFSVPHLFALALGKCSGEQRGGVGLQNISIGGNIRLFCKIFHDMFATMKLLLARSGLLGVLVGIVPGVGGSVATMVSYYAAKRASRHPEQFGKGAPEGIAAPEASNNGLVGGSLIPVLALGIPGSPAAAIFMGAIFLHGMTPGPNFLSSQGNLVYLLIVAVFLAAVVQLLLGLFTIGSFARILGVPPCFLFPAILVICSIGAYVVRGLEFDIWLFAGFGIASFFLVRLGFNSGAFILGMILGAITERSLLEAITLAHAKGTLLEYFLGRHIAVGMVVLLAVYMGWRVYRFWRRKRDAGVKNGRTVMNGLSIKGPWTDRRIWDAIYALALLAVCAFLYPQLDDLPEKTALFPGIVLQVIMCCMAALLVKAIFWARLYISMPEPIFGRINWPLVLLIIAIWICYLFGISLLGFYPASCLAVIILTFSLNVHSEKSIPGRLGISIAFSILFTGAAWVLFHLIFQINTPTGIWGF